MLVTERFELWQPRASDLPDLCRLLEHPEMTRFLGPATNEAKSQFDRLLRNAGSWALYGYGILAARPRGQGTIVATCGVFHSFRGFGKGMDDVPEAGWIVRQDWWGQGVAREIVGALLAWFDAVHGPQRIVCMIEDGNAASMGVAAGFGFALYDRQEPEGEETVALNLYERLPG
nr:GNAT family protein [Novosphingobium profundi]